MAAKPKVKFKGGIKGRWKGTGINHNLRYLGHATGKGIINFLVSQGSDRIIRAHLALMKAELEQKEKHLPKKQRTKVDISFVMSCYQRDYCEHHHPEIFKGKNLESQGVSGQFVGDVCETLIAKYGDRGAELAYNLHNEVDKRKSLYLKPKPKKAAKKAVAKKKGAK